MHKFYYTYKITLLKGSLAGHYYYGQHRTNNLNDGYAGSGKVIKDYFKKYDKIEHQTYIKEIISFYNSLEELNKAEFELIGDKYNTDPLCLNLKAGGNQIGYSKELLDKLSENHKDVSGKNNPMFGKKGIDNPNYGRKNTEETKKKISESLKGKQIWWKGKHHSEETKQKMREAHNKNKKL